MYDLLHYVTRARQSTNLRVDKGKIYNVANSNTPSKTFNIKKCFLHLTINNFKRHKKLKLQ